MLVWTLSFGYQFFLYSRSFRSSVINNEWSFGQIVAVIIWAPSLVETLNLEIRESFSI